MSQAAKAHEPSMEEILASIRRIIADDEAVKPSEPVVRNVTPVAPVRPPPRPMDSPRPASLALRDPMEAFEERRPDPPKPDPFNTDSFKSELLRSTVSPTPPAAPVFRAEPSPSVRREETLFSSPPPPVAEEPIVEAVAPELDQIAPEPLEPFAETAFHDSEPEPAYYEYYAEPDALLSNHASEAVTSAFNSLAHTVLVQNAQTLDDLVREMLRPMLKTWLDNNLPTVVERLVRAEIERVSRGR